MGKIMKTIMKTIMKMNMINKQKIKKYKNLKIFCRNLGFLVLIIEKVQVLHFYVYSINHFQFLLMYHNPIYL
jgi:hypothetical protein